MMPVVKENVLNVKDLRVYYHTPQGPIRAVDGVSLNVYKGERFGLVGESGCGKSTTAMALLRLVQPPGKIEGGQIWLYKVDHVLTTVISKFHLASGREQAQALVVKSLEVVGLRPSGVLGKYPHQLSGGQRQRVMLARAFLLKPRLIVADEPVSMLDASLRAMVLDIMLRLKRDFGISFLYITHDLSTAYQISDDLFILYQGSIAERGKATSLIERPQHPYTQLLVDSIPIPNPRHKWQGRVDLPPEQELGTSVGTGCKFADRCPHVMDVCHQSRPPLILVAEDQYAACYLHQ